MENKQFATKLLTANLNIIKEEIVPLIEVGYVQLLVDAVLENISATAILLTDENPENKAQILQLWKSFGENPKLLEAERLAFVNNINKIEDDSVKQSLLLLSDSLLKTLAAVSDTNPNNGEQIKEIWSSFLKSDDFKAFLIQNIDFIIHKLVKNDRLANTVEKMIELFMAK